MSCSLILFTKVPGQTACKTRLIETSSLSSETVDKLALAFLKDVIDEASQTKASKFIFTEPELNKSLELNLNSWQIRTQIKSSFSERLETASREVPAGGLIIIGSDCPTLSADTISKAIDEVENNKFVLGPSSSGGIYLLGIPESAREKNFSIRKVFDEIRSTELEKFSEEVSKTHCELKLLPFNFDVDVENDLVTLIAYLNADLENKSYSKKAIQDLGLEIEKNRNNNRELHIRYTNRE